MSILEAFKAFIFRSFLPPLISELSSIISLISGLPVVGRLLRWLAELTGLAAPVRAIRTRVREYLFPFHPPPVPHRTIDQKLDEVLAQQRELMTQYDHLRGDVTKVMEALGMVPRSRALTGPSF